MASAIESLYYFYKYCKIYSTNPSIFVVKSIYVRIDKVPGNSCGWVHSHVSEIHAHAAITDVVGYSARYVGAGKALEVVV